MANRLLVVGWMVGGLFGAAIAMSVPATVGYGAAVRWAGSGTDLRHLQVAMLWTVRVALCTAIWFLSKRAARVAGSLGPSGLTIFISALGGVAVGLVVGLAVESLWGQTIALAAGLHADSVGDDVVTAAATLGYGLAVFAATFVSKKGTAAA
jgi:hypothetical protein